MAEKKIKIAFASGGIIPAAVIGAAKDKAVGPHEAVSVPESYGKQLITDRFAYEVKTAAQAKKDDKALADAQKAVADAEAAVVAAGDDADKKASAETALAEAKAALAALEG